MIDSKCLATLRRAMNLCSIAIWIHYISDLKLLHNNKQRSTTDSVRRNLICELSCIILVLFKAIQGPFHILKKLMEMKSLHNRDVYTHHIFGLVSQLKWRTYTLCLYIIVKIASHFENVSFRSWLHTHTNGQTFRNISQYIYI